MSVRPDVQPFEIMAALGLGGNVGDVAEAMGQAVVELAAAPGIALVAMSSLYRTAPWGPVTQAPFLNMAALVHASLPPHALLDLCLAIEKRHGRVRAERFGPRTLDIDILAFDGLVFRDERLTVPHPRLLDRAFAMVPLAEIAPTLSIGGIKAADAAARIDRTGIERLADPAHEAARFRLESYPFRRTDRSSSMWRGETHILTSALPPRIWSIWRDVPSWKSWNAGIETIVMHGRFETGATFDMRPPGEAAFTSRLVVVDPPRRFIDETIVGNVCVLVEHRCEEIGPRETKIVYASTVTGPDAEAVGKAVTADFPEVLAALKNLAEKDQ